VLDGLFLATEPVDEAGHRPSIPFDYLAVAEELHSGRIKVSSGTLDAEYGAHGEADADLVAEFSAFLDQAQSFAAEGTRQPEEKLPPIDPEAIAAELGLGRAGAAVDFGHLRRSFAFSNHPDRVAPHLRQRAMVRMQIANTLIDEAKRKALAATRR
jgi:hypothetical protein